MSPNLRPGRPRKNPDAPMTAAERQAARRRRLMEEMMELRRTVEAQAREINELREMQRLIRNILVGEQGGDPDPPAYADTLLNASTLVRRVERAMARIKGPMNMFAIGGKKMNRETRRAVFAEICAIDEEARFAKRSLLLEEGNRPAWARGERDWT